MKGMERIEESLCEKSMKVVSNVIKMSALSIAKRSLGTTVGNPDASRSFHQPSSTTTSSVHVVLTKPVLRAQKPQTNTNQTYLVEPERDDNKSSSSLTSYVVKEDMNVDGRASDYIRKVREKNQKDVFVSSENPSNKMLSSHVVK